MISGDLLQDWSSDSISSHMIHAKSPVVKKKIAVCTEQTPLHYINYVI